jgi:hypothetical protein
LEENKDSEDSEGDGAGPGKGGRPQAKPPKEKRYSRTDPDATMTTNNKAWRMEPSYKQHTAVDDQTGVIVDVRLTTGEISEGQQLPEQLARIERLTGVGIKTATADAGYAHSGNYRVLEERGINAVIPPQARPDTARHIPARRFRYDAKHEVLRCPGGKKLYRKGRSVTPAGWLYRARHRDCAACPLRTHCLPKTAKARTMVVVDGYEALLRARRRKERGWDEETRILYNRHRWRVEGIHGEAKTQHGLRRAVRRGLENVAVQVYMTAAVMNLKRLAKAALLPLYPPLKTLGGRWGLVFADLRTAFCRLVDTKENISCRQHG